MSILKLQGNASGTGALTIAAPNTNTDRTLTLPDNTGTLVSTASTPTLTGAVTAPAFIPNDSTVPTNGLYLPAANTPAWSSNSTKVVSVIKGSSLALEGATPQAGTGITFPATQSASTDVNTLDDYEEGTWTPSLGGTATYTEQVGVYTKIGRQVTIWANVTVSSIGTGSTTIISGAPFTPATGSTYMPGSVYWESLAVSETSLISFIQAGSGNIYFAGRATSSTSIDNTVAIFGNSARVRLCITYNV